MEVLIVVIIIFCGVKIRKFVSKAVHGELTPQLIEINRQLSQTLILQAILPLIAIFIGAFCSFVCIWAYFVLEFPSLYFVAYGTLPVPLIPVLNPVITILVVKQYRRRVDAMIHCRTGVVGGNSMMQMTQAQNSGSRMYPSNKTA